MDGLSGVTGSGSGSTDPLDGVVTQSVTQSEAAGKVDTAAAFLEEVYNSPFAALPMILRDFQKIITDNVQTAKETAYSVQLYNSTALGDVTQGAIRATLLAYKRITDLNDLLSASNVTYDNNDQDKSNFNNYTLPSHSSSLIDNYNSAKTTLNNDIDDINSAKAAYLNNPSQSNQDTLNNKIQSYNTDRADFNTYVTALNAQATTFNGKVTNTNTAIDGYNTTLKETLSATDYASLTGTDDHQQTAVSTLASAPQIFFSSTTGTLAPPPGHFPTYNTVANTMSGVYNAGTSLNDQLKNVIKNVTNSFLRGIGINKHLRRARRHLDSILFVLQGQPVSLPAAFAKANTSLSAGPSTSGGGISVGGGAALLNLILSSSNASSSTSVVTDNAINQANQLAETNPQTERLGNILQILLASVIPYLSLKAGKDTLDSVKGTPDASNMNKVQSTLAVNLAANLLEFAKSDELKKSVGQVIAEHNFGLAKDLVEKMGKNYQTRAELSLNLSALALLGIALNKPYLAGETFAQVPNAQNNGATKSGSRLSFSDTLHSEVTQQQLSQYLSAQSPSNQDAIQKSINDVKVVNADNKNQYRRTLRDVLIANGVSKKEARQIAHHATTFVKHEQKLGPGIDAKIPSYSGNVKSLSDVSDIVLSNKHLNKESTESALRSFEDGSPRDVRDRIAKAHKNLSPAYALYLASSAVAGLVPKAPESTASLTDQVSADSAKVLGSNGKVDINQLYSTIKSNTNTLLSQLPADDQKQFVKDTQKALRPTENLASYVHDVLLDAGHMLAQYAGVSHGTGYDDRNSVQQTQKKTTDIII